MIILLIFVWIKLDISRGTERLRFTASK